MKSIKYILLLCFLALVSSIRAYSQQTLEAPTNSWFLLLNRAKLSKHWLVTNEIHQRNQWFFQGKGQFLWRPSLDYRLNDQVEFSLGYSYISTHTAAPYPIPIATKENNIWQQVNLKFDVGKVHFQNRFRQENRWFDHVDDENGTWVIHGDDYANRFRYRLTGTFDVLSLQNGKHALFLNLFDEIWFNQDNRLRPISFARNWAYVGLGYRLDSKTNFQTGYMHQWDQVKGQYIKMDIVQFTISKSFDFSHPKI